MKNITRTITTTLPTIVKLEEVNGEFSPVVNTDEILVGELTIDEVSRAMKKKYPNEAIQVTSISHETALFTMPIIEFMEMATIVEQPIPDSDDSAQTSLEV